MSDNDDLLGDDLGDQSLADYNLGNEEEDQLLADDYESGPSQNVPSSVGHGYNQDIVAHEYVTHGIDFSNQNDVYGGPQVPLGVEAECVVPDVSPATGAPYLPYRDPHANALVPSPIPAAPLESPQIVPSEINAPLPNDCRGRGSGRPQHRTPQLRDLPDSLDKVLVPRGFGRASRTSWRNPHYAHAHAHAYRRHNVQRGSFLQQRQSFPPQIRHEAPQLRPEPQIRPDLSQLRVEPQIRLAPPQPALEPPPVTLEPPPGLMPPIRLEPPQIGTDIIPERPIMVPEPPVRPFRPNLENRLRQNQGFHQRFPANSNFGPNIEDKPNFRPHPNFERPPGPYPFQQRSGPFNQRPFRPPAREIVPNSMNHMPQVTIRQNVPHLPPGLHQGDPKMEQFPQKLGARPHEFPMEQEVRMLPVLPPNVPPGGLAGKKVLINPHFKGNFQPPVEGLATYIPTRIEKSPPLSPTIENRFGPVKDIDDAAERFIAEQRSALARAAAARDSRRYIENTTIEIENELARGERQRRKSEDELLRRQEEFINANRAGLRRRMRSRSRSRSRSLSPSLSRRSPSPRRAPRARDPAPRAHDEDVEYRRRVREQENLRERVLRAKEVRRRKNAVALQKQIQDRERERAQHAPERDSTNGKGEPERRDRDGDGGGERRDRDGDSEPATTPPRAPAAPPAPAPPAPPAPLQMAPREASPERALTPPLPSAPPPAPPPAAPAPAPAPARDRKVDYDFDDLDLILDDFEGILSDDEDAAPARPAPPAPPARPDDHQHRPESPKAPKPSADLRSRLPPRDADPKRTVQRQKIVFTSDDKDTKKKEITPPRRSAVSNSKKSDADSETNNKEKSKSDISGGAKRQRIIFGNNSQPRAGAAPPRAPPPRRVVLQRGAGAAGAAGGVFGRALRSTIGAEAPAAVAVANLPPGITDTRLRSLAGADVQNINLDKSDRSARIVFKSSAAAEGFRRKFNNKLVAASRLSVALQ